MKLQRTLLASAILLAFHPALFAQTATGDASDASATSTSSTTSSSTTSAGTRTASTTTRTATSTSNRTTTRTTTDTDTGASADNSQKVQKVVVTASPLRNAAGDQILTPAKVLSGDELRDKVGSSLGETLQNELGVSSSAFGAGASRPIIRGMEGSRVMMMENGMPSSDVSGQSNDHAVASEGATAKQIEILRGPAALLYGSGAIGGLVNVVNERIPTEPPSATTGTLESRYSTVDQGKNASGSVDGASGKLAWHVDGNWRDTSDYKIPGSRVLNDPASGGGRLPNSDTTARSVGAGASWIDDFGYVGVSAAHLTNVYGIPTEEGSRISQRNNRYDIDSLFKAPIPGIETARFKAGYTDYWHAELDHSGAQNTIFTNRAFDTRLELTHKPIAGLHGSFGIQTDNAYYSAVSAEGGPDTVPPTHSTSSAVFVVEETDIGPVKTNAGLRYETVKRVPVNNRERTFNLSSGSVGGMWPFMPGYGFGATLSYAQRAPATEELYSGGPHDATLTFDVGDPNLKKEISRNVELTLQKTSGLVRWKANLFRDNVSNFIYGHVTGLQLDADGNPGGSFDQRLFQQAKAHVQGAEAELDYNPVGHGLNGRLFADTSHGKFDGDGYLPLQPADRIGAEIGYRQADWRTSLSWTHARGMDRLASFETTATPAYNLVDANLSYTQHLDKTDLTWFLLAKNLLNQDIRMSTSLLKDIAPLPGRNFVFGVRAKF